MRATFLIVACLACCSQARKDSTDDLATLLFALHPTARVSPGTGIGAHARPAFAPTQSRLAAAQMGEEPDSAVATGAAGAAALLGVYFEQDILTVGLLALAAAYTTTLGNELGDAAKSVGGVTSKGYNKAKEFNEKYDVLPKAKTAADVVVNVADNLNQNYGITAKIDQKLLIGEKYERAKDKVDKVTSSVTSKVDELKESAKSS